VTAAEAKAVLAVALGGTVAREMDADALKFMRSHLLPLPYAPVASRVHDHVAAHKWCSCLAELLDACGMPPAARTDLTRAVREGGALVRDLRSMTGWSYVAPGEEPPPGAIEAAAVAEAPASVRALPPRTAAAEERARAVADRVAALAEARRVRPGLRALPAPAEVEASLEGFESRYRAASGA
jgi:hypothetical protein